VLGDPVGRDEFLRAGELLKQGRRILADRHGVLLCRGGTVAVT
jgi:hypothetical protein